MATYYVRDDGNDSNDGSCNCADKAKKTIDAGKAACAVGDMVIEGDKVRQSDGKCPGHIKQGDGSFEQSFVRPLQD